MPGVGHAPGFKHGLTGRSGSAERKVHLGLQAADLSLRRFCPSCGTRRRLQTAEHLVAPVIPHVPVGQRVLSPPIALRHLAFHLGGAVSTARRDFLPAGIEARQIGLQIQDLRPKSDG